MRLSEDYARGFPRLFIDADVELGTDDARALAAALAEPGILAVAPDRTHTVDGRSWVVRSYYDIWERLPVVQNGLFGRGVFGVSELGHRRLATMPQAMSDDLIASVAFTSTERKVVSGARVVVHPPVTTGDLIRCRVRALTGTVQLQRQLPEPVAEARTSTADLVGIVRSAPRTAPRMAIFLAVTLWTRLKARRALRTGDFATWLRDESSRTIPAQRSPARPHDRHNSG